MTNLAQLLTDLRAAKEGNRSLGDRVNQIFGWYEGINAGNWRNPKTGIWSTERPNPTTSVDAASKNTPKNHDAIVHYNASGNGCAYLEWIVGGRIASGELITAATTALALSIAILEERQSHEGS